MISSDTGICDAIASCDRISFQVLAAIVHLGGGCSADGLLAAAPGLDRVALGRAIGRLEQRLLVARLAEDRVRLWRGVRELVRRPKVTDDGRLAQLDWMPAADSETVPIERHWTPPGAVRALRLLDAVMHDRVSQWNAFDDDRRAIWMSGPDNP